MVHGIWSQPAALPTSEKRSGQRFETLANEMIKATPGERETTLKDVAKDNPGLANRLRQFFDKAPDQQQATLQRLSAIKDQVSQIIGVMSPADRAAWQGTDKAPDAGIVTPPASGILGQSRHSILFEPEPETVLGTTPPPKGMVTAFGTDPAAAKSQDADSPTLPWAQALAAYWGTTDHV